MTASLSKMSLCSLCLPFAKMSGCVHHIKQLWKAKFAQLVHCSCFLHLPEGDKEEQQCDNNHCMRTGQTLTTAVSKERLDGVIFLCS